MIKKGWKEKKLSELSLKITDGTHSTVKNNPSGKYYLLSCKNIKNGVISIDQNDRRIDKETVEKLRSRTKLEKNDILITTVGTIGELAIIKEENIPYELQRSVGIIKPDPKSIDPYFLYSYMCSPKYQGLINGLSRGVAQQCLFLDPLRNSTIQYPEELIEQQKIATFLSNYDDLIENNIKRIQLLEKMAKLIYEEWFVKFRFPGHEKVKMVDSELGKIPDGWEVKKLDNFAEITSSKRIYAKEYVGKGVPFYRSREIIQKFNHDTIKTNLFISKERYGEIDEKFGVPKKEDILLTSVGTLGIPYLVSDDEQFYFKDGNLIWMKDIEKHCSIFIYYWLISDNGKQTLLGTSIGTSQAAFTIANLKKINIAAPSISLLIKFENVVGSMKKKIELIEKTNHNLKKTRDLLLPRLITGKVDVSNLDIHVPGVEA